MSKIYLMWIVDKKRSLWIYSQNLFGALKKETKVVDRRKIYTDISRFKTTVVQFFENVLPHSIKWFEDDDIILHSHSSFIFSPLWNLKRSVIVVHDLVLYDDDYYTLRPTLVKLLKYWNKIIWKRMYKRMLYKCLWIIAISQWTKDDIIKKFWNLLEWKIEVVYNWADLSIFKPSKWEKRPQRLRDKYVCYIWSEMERKNLKNIIWAFAIIKKEFPDLKLMKAPMEKTSDRDKTLKYVENNNLRIWKDIIFIDEYLPVERLVELYQYAEVFIFPSLKEWFWFPILEAQACWTPVVTTNYNPMKELVPYKNMTVDPYDPSDIAEKTIKILKDNNLREKMSLSWLENSTSFTWENTAKKMLRFIKKL